VVPDLRAVRRLQRRRRVPGPGGVGGALRPGERVRGQVAAGVPEAEHVFQFVCGMRKAFGLD
jgi:hypothetical protein